MRDASTEALLAAEERMNKKWGHHAWSRLCSPGMAYKYFKLRSQWYENKNVQLADNLVKGLAMIDAEISQSNKPDDFYYLHHKGEETEFFLVADEFDQQRVTAKMRGKNCVVFTMAEVMEVMEASKMAELNKIKASFPSSRLQNVTFHHDAGDINDEIPF